jgi:hypothetical protein
MPVNYLVEINSRASFKPVIATPADWISRQYDLYYIDLQSPRKIPGYKKTYWEEWGGWYNMPDSARVEVYIMDWMERTDIFNEILTTPLLFYVDEKARRLYFNAPKHPWLYETWETQLTKTEGFLHTAKNQQNPSDTYINDDYLRVILDEPSDNRKLPDPIHGVDLFLSFSIKLNNASGFELLDTELYFNGPARLYKTLKDMPSYSDFIMIRTGIVDDISITKDSVTFTCAEKYRTLEQNVCKTITSDEWVINTLEAAGKSLPIIFGRQETQLIKIMDNTMARFIVEIPEAGEEEKIENAKNADFTTIVGVYDKDGNRLEYEIDGLYIIAENTAETLVYSRVRNTGQEDEYIPIDEEITVNLQKSADMPVRFLAAEYITRIHGVYDREDNPLDFTLNGLVITAPREADYAVVEGYANNRLGDIVIHLISIKGGVLYTNTFWDVAETDAYRNTSPRLNIAIKSGTVRSAINEVLKSDMVFLIQKNNARFTLRSWGKQYGVFNIDEYLITQEPSKNWKDAQKYWFSSCVVKYSKNDRTGGFDNQIFLKDKENDIQEKYNKKTTAEFETRLTRAEDARNLAARLAARFNYLKETVTIGVGKDTSEINQLDTVMITISVNDRLYSHVKKWIVKEIDPAQDKMTLEAV